MENFLFRVLEQLTIESTCLKAQKGINELRLFGMC